MPYTKAQVEMQKETLKQLREEEVVAYNVYETAEWAYRDVCDKRKEALIRLGEMIEIGYV